MKKKKKTNKKKAYLKRKEVGKCNHNCMVCLDLEKLRALTLCIMWSNDKFKQVRDFEWDGRPLVKF